MSENETGHISAAIRVSTADSTQRPMEKSSERYSEMRNCSFFAPIPDDQLYLLARQSRLEKFASGACITTENTPGSSLFVIMSGYATAYIHKKKVGIINSGECIGEGAFFIDEHSSSATVVASGEVTALELKKKVVDTMSGEVKTYIDKALLHALFRKLRRSNKLIEILLDSRSE